MVHILIRMRAAALAHASTSRFGALSLIVGALVGLTIALSTFVLGFGETTTDTGGASRLALVTLTWVAGRIGFAAFSGGDPAVPIDLFRLVPVPQRRLARALLAIGFADPALLFMALAFGSTIVFGFRHGPAAGLTAAAGSVALLAAVSMLSTIVGALTPTGSRRRQDAGALLAALLISVVAVAGTLIGPLLSHLGSGQQPALGTTLRVLPTGWVAEATLLATRGDPAALLPLAALAIACALLAAWWPRILADRLVSGGSARRRSSDGNRRRLLPASAVGAVTGREVRAWIRDPNRAGFLLIAFIVGIGVCVVPLLSHGTTLLLPFAGLGTVVIAAAVSGNSFGFDGPCLALVLGVPGAERAEIRGRQLAWFLLVGPYSIGLAVAGLLVAGQRFAWPWVFGLLPAFLGGAVGLFPLISLIAVQPLDDNGTPGPTWVVKTYLTLLLTLASGLPAIGFLVAGALTDDTWIGWLAVPVGIVSGACCAIWLGRAAVARLRQRGAAIFEQLASAPAGRK
ncbi:hypothetical protein NONO_c31320 [Nocardia nova SH22a]|uniref:ABC-2 type transport system permease protein n=1 Tax=Nocardia nova SH22a TaxID=1415166 RepID=W5TFK9_9NOCA|nr:hypothetical protein [Nocardia nova]AHH17919.1 hypothetical protein NONO_c31320 [Nocardia nova SH22a]